MSYHSHKLSSVSHSHIIGRTDPITGDFVNENDNVVFCAVCKSCFLEESWIYMDESHCEQEKTLETVPTLPTRLIAKKMTEEVITELRKKVHFIWIGVIAMLLSFFIFETFFTINDYFSEKTFRILASFASSILLGTSLSFVTSTDLFRRFIGFERIDLSVFKNRIKIGKDIFYLENIKQIKFQREMKYVGENPASKTPILFIYFHDGTRQIKNLPTKDYKSIDLFLKGLVKISNLIELFLYSEQSQEHIIIKRISKNTKGNIIVGEPLKLLADKAYPHQF